nr:MAG TPA: hypothetical protein [Caudoviricetes sp.]
MNPKNSKNTMGDLVKSESPIFKFKLKRIRR